MLHIICHTIWKISDLWLYLFKLIALFKLYSLLCNFFFSFFAYEIKNNDFRKVRSYSPLRYFQNLIKMEVIGVTRNNSRHGHRSPRLIVYIYSLVPVYRDPIKKTRGVCALVRVFVSPLKEPQLSGRLGRKSNWEVPTAIYRTLLYSFDLRARARKAGFNERVVPRSPRRLFSPSC